tara:strand:+ start:315 stop:596 length:282 start_codon:yes stop_codon:yes gene_type:complete
MTWALIGFLMELGVPALTGSQQGVKIATRVIGPITDRQIVGDVFMGSLLRWTTLCQRTMVRRRPGYFTGTAAFSASPSKPWVASQIMKPTAPL